MSETPAPESFLPLRPVEAQILVSLTRGQRHGYAILQELQNQGSGPAPGLATLYRALRRLEGDGLLEEVRGEEETRNEERKTTYRLSVLGRRVAAAEARRLASLVELARKGLGDLGEA